MPLRLGFSVGDSFVEGIGAPADDSPLPPVRWYLPRKSLADGLKETLGDRVAQGGDLRICSSLAGFSLQKKLGTTPVFLVTTGFENWLKLNSSLTLVGREFRALLPLNEDLVFGIAERVRADGQVEAALSIEDLQFLAAKLEMLKTKTIAVGLLHSHRNPTHEIQIRDYFRERGYQVFCSHSYTSSEHADEREHWKRAAFDAYAWTAMRDQREEIETALGEHKDKWTIRFAASSADSMTLQENPGFSSAFGAAESLAQAFGGEAPVLHLGLERFVLITQSRAEVHAPEPGAPTFPSVSHRRLDVQPASQIESGFWPSPMIGPVPFGFEPGPMALGKAHRPTVFDILFTLDRLEPIEGVTSLIQEKSRARITESLFTLSKAIAKSPNADTRGGRAGSRLDSRIDPQMVARDLETLAIELILQELLTLEPCKEVVVTGALARSLHPRLEARRPDLRFRLAKDAEWAEAIAARDADGQKNTTSRPQPTRGGAT